MKAYEVYLNGQYLLTAGTGSTGVLTSVIAWTTVSPPAAPGGEFHFHVGGVDGQTGEHVDYSVPKVQVGDEIRIKIVETDRVTPEDRRYVFNGPKPGESFEDFAPRLKAEGEDEPGTSSP